MGESFDNHTVLRLLSELDRRDARRKVFGSPVHQYKLQAPLPRAVIEAFEGQHAVTFPDDYRYFMTEIGNGGAGPFYGLFPFGEQDDCRDNCAWEGGGLVGDVSRPFPHAVAWNLPDSFWQGQPDPPPDIPLEEEDRLMEAWYEELEERYWHPSIMDGAIPICHRGCALRQWLVIQGEQKGFVWSDDRVDDGGIYPLRDGSGRQVTFSDWYMSWLEQSLRECPGTDPPAGSVKWWQFWRRGGSPIVLGC